LIVGDARGILVILPEYCLDYHATSE
jgi:hypothetical protein